MANNENIYDEEEEKSYNDSLERFYEENSSYLMKIVLGASSLAFPFIFNSLVENKMNDCGELLLKCSLVSFLLVIIIQIIELNLAKKGCSDGQSSEEKKQSISVLIFKTLDVTEIIKHIIFTLGLTLVTISVLVQ